MSSLLPTFEDLSAEQEAVYRLPLDRSSLVSGPPGTGKTVLALYRAQRLMRSKSGFRLITHARPLMQYVSGAAAQLGIDGSVDTFHSFLWKWWRSRGRRSVPSIANYRYDWNRIVADLEAAPATEAFRHLVVDEGQDIPPMFWIVQKWLTPSLTVFADENQRITEDNSTLREIISSSGIRDSSHHRLTRNYRNTAEIHAVATVFDVGLDGTTVEAPSRSGDPPEMLRFDNSRQDVDFIARVARLRRDWQIGVLVQRDSVRKKLVNQLEHRLGDRDDPEVQTYNAELGRAGIELDWTVPGIFVLCYQSAKGLQFDHVFLPRLETATGDPGDELLRMQFYVLVTRARHALTVSWTGPPESSRPTLADMFPTHLMELDE